ncbi:expressed unknown protein [Ectocarpus siliculosus]|uniref:Uncharacterized protein n=1 Tax=Ectocarpus siliculosus TaxID=2880 RepID=D7FUT3_ECTSI|nr:expressed unknown protein [Ectocarpus siliculosus]|eukprot:CBJ31739.1 expressed unknown protein [Ectocarpus siliculosus]
MVQMTKPAEKCGETLDADAFDQEAKLDLAEELFVSCRFTEAARVCSAVLGEGSSCTSSPRRNFSSTSTSTTATTSSGSHDPAGSALVVAFDDQVIAPVGECGTSDLIVAVLLQCGFELQRTEEWGRCRAFYGTTRAIPFAVAILWLRLRLAGGELELVRRILWQLRAELGEEVRRCTPAVTANNSDFERAHSGAVTPAVANYSEATEMLVVQIMVPCGEFTEAEALVSSDAYLSPKDKSQLLKACEQSASERERESGAATGEGSTGNASNTASGSRSPCGRGGPSHSSYREDYREETKGGPQRDGRTRLEHSSSPDELGAAFCHQQRQQQQSPLQKFFSDVSDWTPEARVQLVVGAGAAGLAAYAALRNRDSLWRAARNAAGVAARTAGDVGAFIVGSS